MFKLIITASVLTVLAAAPASAQSAKSKNVKIRGYVTELRSPTDFDIEDYRITRDGEFTLDFENADPAIRFRLDDIRVGVELEIRGRLDQTTGELKATAIKVDLEQFKNVKQTAVIAKAPAGIEKTAAGWSGEILVDGQRVVVTPATEVVYKLTSREKKLQKSNKGAEANEDFAPVRSLDQIGVGMALTYEGPRRIADGAIAATRLEVSNNDLEDGEAKMWKSLKISSKPANALSGGELKIDKVGKFKLLPDDSVQKYVADLGARLIPAYQRELPDDAPQKIPFQFFVVSDDSANAFALPNGIVVVHSGLIDILDNEAQLAAVVGHEIAHAVQEHSWRQTQYHKKKRFALALANVVASAYGAYDIADLLTLVDGAIRNGHSRSLENQADRIGLEYMAAAGYDPREAPNVWKLMTKRYGLQTTNVFWSSHENQATRRSYLMNELKNNYRQFDFAASRLGEPEFREIRERTREASSRKTRIKVR